MKVYTFQLPKSIVITARIIYIFFEVIFIIIGRIFVETPKEIFIKIVLRVWVSRERAWYLKNLIKAHKEQCADYPHLKTKKERAGGAKVQDAKSECRRAGVSEWRINLVFEI